MRAEHTRLRGRREALLALLAALAFFAWPLRAALLDPARVACAVDTATAQLPWSAVLERAEPAPRNPALSDQGMVFYPARRWVLESWARGDPPLWNPLLYAGAPGVGNPQLGVLDPQVLALLPLELLGGRALADVGWGLSLWLRLSAAALGAWLLARELGLSRRGGALAALGYCGSGASLLWAGFPVGHVTWLLPWVLLALERTRGPRPWRAVASGALAFGLALLGGHPETAFHVGLAGGVWALAIARRERAAGGRALLALGLGTLLGCASLVPFAEYLRHSGALVARRALAPPALDLLALGVLAIGAGAWLRWRALRSKPAACSERNARSSPGRTVAGGALAGLTVAGLVALLGLPSAARLALAHDLLGVPGLGQDGWRGHGSWLELASPWVPALVLALAVAAVLTRPAALAAAPARLRRRGLVLALGAAALLLALRAPGLVELHARLPLVGLGATARMACVAALMLALLAGEALDAAPRGARVAGALALLLLGLLASRGRDVELPPAEALATDPADELVELVERPEGLLEGELRLAGRIHPAVPAAFAGLRVERVLPSGATAPLFDGALPLLLAPGAAEGARDFAAPPLDSAHLAPGAWRFVLELRGPQGELLGERIVASGIVARAPRWRPFTLLAFAASLLCAALLPAAPGGWMLALVLAVAGAQVLDLARFALPSVPRAEVFPPTHTEALVAELCAGGGRYLADPGVLPPDTGMVRGLRAADGYDALDPASFDAYRPLALRAGAHPLLGFHASGADLDAPAFRLLGVRALLRIAPLEHPGWELVAAPDGLPRAAEVRVYRPRDPLPRAFCVAEARPLPADPRALEGFDPARTVLLEPGVAWRAERPFARADVRAIAWTNNRVELDVELDGDGLLVLCEQAFPGWRVDVDGARGELLVANGIFRAVPLEAGAHRVVFRYRPASLAWGAALAALGVTGLLGCAAAGLRRG